MITLIDGMRNIIGVPSFTDSVGNIDYALICEYFVASILLCIVVSSIFKIVKGFLK